MATTFQKLISLMAYDATLTERTDDFYLRAKTTATPTKSTPSSTAWSKSRRTPSPPATSSTPPPPSTSPPPPARCSRHVGPLLNGAVAETRAADGVTKTETAPTPGKNLTLTGRNIKVVGTDPSVGVTFTSVESPQTTVKVGPADITVNEPSRLIFVLPEEVTDGLWTVSVTTQAGSSNRHLVKEPRTYVLDTPLAVGTAYQEPEEEGGGSTQPGGNSGAGEGNEGSFG